MIDYFIHIILFDFILIFFNFIIIIISFHLDNYLKFYKYYFFIFLEIKVDIFFHYFINHYVIYVCWIQ